jgi:hypothetical protein
MAENKNLGSQNRGQQQDLGREQNQGGQQGSQRNTSNRGLGSMDEDLQQNVSTGNQGQGQSSRQGQQGQQSEDLSRDEDLDMEGGSQGANRGNTGNTPGSSGSQSDRSQQGQQGGSQSGRGSDLGSGSSNR